GLEFEGRFVRLDADTLVLWTGPGGSTAAAATDRSFAISDLTRLDRGVPRSSWRGAGRGTLWGVLIGGLAGAGLGSVQETDCFLCPSSKAEGAMIGSIVLGGAGAVVGALVGAAWPGTRWESVPLPRPSDAAAPETGRDR
ncbi:MAG TPA: hypothetical protein VM778_12100, partial [Gemmatimonadota bacterium]|nr:hypothetical protein [Gemmatimonadota bacterium]